MPDDFDDIERRFGGRAPAAPVADDFDAIEARFAAPGPNLAKQAITPTTVKDVRESIFGPTAEDMDLDTQRKILGRITGTATSPGGVDLAYPDTDSPNYRRQIRVEMERYLPGARSKEHGAALLANLPEKPPEPEAATTGEIATTIAKRAAHGITSPPAFLADTLLGAEGAGQLRSEHLYAPGSGAGLSPEREAIARKAIESSSLGRAGNMTVDILAEMGSFKTLGRGVGKFGANPVGASSATMATHGGLNAGEEGFGGGAIFGAILPGISMPLNKWIQHLPDALKGTVVNRLANAAEGGTAFAGADTVMNGFDAERFIANFAFGGATGWMKAVARVEAKPDTPVETVAAIGRARMAEAEQTAAETKQAEFDAAVAGEPKTPEPVEVTLKRGENRLAAQAAPEAAAAPREEVIQPRAGEPTTEAAPEKPYEYVPPTPREQQPPPRMVFEHEATSAPVAREKSPMAMANEYAALRRTEKDAEYAEFHKFDPNPESVPVRKQTVSGLVSALAKDDAKRIGGFSFLRAAQETGWYSDGKMAVEMPPASRPALSAIAPKDPQATAAPIKKVLDAGLSDVSTKPARLVGVRDQAPEHQIPTQSYAMSDGTRSVILNAQYVRTILGIHPDAKFYLPNGKGPVVAKVGNKPVGVIAPIAGVPEMRGAAPAPKAEAPAAPELTLVGRTNKGVGVYQRPGYQPGDTLVTRTDSGRLGAAHPGEVAEARANALAEAARKPAVPEQPAPPPSVGEQVAQHFDRVLNPGGESVSGEAGFVHPEVLAAAGGAAAKGIGRVAQAAKDVWNGLAGKTYPRTAAESPKAAEALASKISTRVTANLFKRRVAEQVLGPDNLDPAEFGAALVESNLRDIRRKRLEEGDDAGGRAVVTTIGAEGAPFATLAEYHAYLARPEVKAALKRHNEVWERDIDPLYKSAQDIAEGTDLPTRGSEADNARVNLMRVDPDGKAVDGGGAAFKPSGPIVGGQGRTGNLFTRLSPFGRKATGAAEGGYVLDYGEMMGNSYNRQATNAYYKQAIREAVATGDGVMVPRGTPTPTTIKGETVRPQDVLDVKGPSGARFVVRPSLSGEFRAALGIDAPAKLPPGIDQLTRLVNKTAIIGITDNVIHTANTVAILLSRPMSGLPAWADAPMSAAGRADLLVTVPKFLGNLWRAHGRTADLEAMASAGALSRYENKPMTGLDWLNPVGGLARATNRIDTAARLTAYDSWKAMAERGTVPNTPASMREFVNQFGQYEGRALGAITRWGRETGLSPWVVAGKRGLTAALRTAAGAPGVNATTVAKAGALRIAAFAKIAGIVAAIGLHNKEKVGKFEGRPGVPMFAWDTGENDKDGKPKYTDPLTWFGVRKAFNITVGGYAEAKRSGLSDSDALNAQLQKSLNALGFMARGPAVDLVAKGLMGHSVGFNMPEYEKVGPGRSQLAENFKSALVEAPKSLMNTTAGVAGSIGIDAPTRLANAITGQEKTSGERGSEALSYFGEKTGRTDAQVDSLPERVRYRQVADFTDDVRSRIVRLSPEKRAAYLKERLDESRLTDDEKSKIRGAMSRYLGGK